MLLIQLKHGIKYEPSIFQFKIDDEKVSLNDVIQLLKDKYETREKLLSDFFQMGIEDGNDLTKSPVIMKFVGKKILANFPH